MIYAILYMFFFWLPFLLTAGPVSAACWFFGRNRVRWFKWEYSILITPYVVWLLFVTIAGDGKSLANAFAEPFYLGCGAALASIIRVAVGKKLNQKATASVLFAAVCILAVMLWAFVSPMPE